MLYINMLHVRRCVLGAGDTASTLPLNTILLLIGPRQALPASVTQRYTGASHQQPGSDLVRHSLIDFILGQKIHGCWSLY